MKVEQYDSYGENLDGYQAKEELLADAVGKLLENEGAIERLVRYDQRMFQKVRYWIEDMIARFRGTPEERRFLQAQRLLERAVEKSSGILAGESSGAYLIYPEFQKSYDNWDKQSIGGYFKVGKTSQALQSIGVPEGEIRWHKSKILEIKKKHQGMTDEVIKSVPNIIEDPIAVFQDTKVNTITIVGEVFDDNGAPVMASLLVDKEDRGGTVRDVSFIRTAFGNNRMQKVFDDRNLLYLNPNKERTDTLLQALRLHWRSGEVKYGPMDSITLSSEGNKSFSSKPDIEAQRQEELRRSELIAEYNRRLGFSDDGVKSLGGELGMPGGMMESVPESEYKTRSFYQSASGSDRVHSEVRQNLLQNIESEATQAMYRVISNDETRDNVVRRLNTQGFDQVEAGLDYKIANNEKMTAEDMATAIGLIEHYSKVGELERAQNMIANLSVIGTELGQAVQIMRLMKHSTPQGR